MAVLALVVLVAWFVVVAGVRTYVGYRQTGSVATLARRLVEEPYLERVHGAAYRDYASWTGRFLPGIGRLRRRAS